MGDITNKELNFIQLLKEKNFNIKTLFDVGLNAGEYSQFILDNFDVKEIHAFEPNEDLLKLTQKDLSGNIVFNNVAIDIKERTTEINILPQYTGMSSLYYREKAFKNFTVVKQQVNTIRLDNYVDDINLINSLIKIDIEGNEFNAIKSLGKYINDISIIQFEYGGCWLDSAVNMQDLIKYIDDTDMILCDFVDGTLIEVKEFTNIVNYHDFNNYFLINTKVYEILK